MRATPASTDTVFEEHRPLLQGLAYRMLGSVADAEDMVQETWLRWSAAERVEVPRAWLVRVCSRLCLDQLKSARHRREVYPGPWLPEPLEPEVLGADAAQRLEIDETVSMALMTAMERLSPAERAALLLHDVFDHDYAEVGGVLDRNEAACRQLVSRARRRVRRPERGRSVAAAQHRRLLDEFLQAAASADFEGLKRVLREDVAFHADGGGKAVAAGRVLCGADEVARFFVGIVRRSGGRFDREAVNWCWYNGAPGAVIVEDGRVVTAFCLRVEAGRIAELYALRNPDKLAGFAGLIP